MIENLEKGKEGIFLGIFILLEFLDLGVYGRWDPAAIGLKQLSEERIRRTEELPSLRAGDTGGDWS